MKFSKNWLRILYISIQRKILLTSFNFKFDLTIALSVSCSTFLLFLTFPDSIFRSGCINSLCLFNPVVVPLDVTSCFATLLSSCWQILQMTHRTFGYSLCCGSRWCQHPLFVNDSHHTTQNGKHILIQKQLYLPKHPPHLWPFWIRGKKFPSWRFSRLSWMSQSFWFLHFFSLNVLY